MSFQSPQRAFPDRFAPEEWVPPPPGVAIQGSLDPTTGIFFPEPPKVRTALACDKCRSRKAKCSGEQPTCGRCSSRGLVCEYTKERRTQGLYGRPRAASSANYPPSRESPSREPDSRRLRRNTTAARPLSSVPYLPFPAHLSASNADKRLSLPASLTKDSAEVYPMDTTDDNGYEASNANDSETSSRRSSYSTLLRSPLDCFEPHRRYGDGKSVPLESSYALEGIHNVVPNLMSMDHTLHPLGASQTAFPEAPLGLGMELLLAPDLHADSGSGSSASGSSFDGDSSGPNSAVEGGFPLFQQAPAEESQPYSDSLQQYHLSPQPKGQFSAHSTSALPPFDPRGQYDVQQHDAAGEYTESGQQLPYAGTTGGGQWKQDEAPEPLFSSYPSWRYQSSYERGKGPSGLNVLRGWVEPPSMPLVSPGQTTDVKMDLAMPVPSRMISQRGVSGLSVVIPESESASSLMSAGGSVPSSAVSANSSALSSPFRPAGELMARTQPTMRTLADCIPTRSVSSSQSPSGAAASPGTTTGGRRRGWTVTGVAGQPGALFGRPPAAQ
ncbi:hypothetical protein FB45DRAFT_1032216 [Roridomyces roridus]|uniref:Zn(2)-C6 fungal-type domain-containing protein n=1 Tax=Roridomyces roridus TaxID=1738132 RepID=A0AAD7BH38_9AGAR|nr:hypothetical protein FB45DRAFT_1032216 [Roridomyces roridus]